MSATEDPIVAALLREREGYERRGLEERVAQVDEQLRLRGHEVDRADSHREPPRKRQAPAKRTAD